MLWLSLRDTSVNDERWKNKAGTSLDNIKFVPERWLVENIKQSSFTFGQGPRVCLGMHAALLEMKVWSMAASASSGHVHIQHQAVTLVL